MCRLPGPDVGALTPLYCHCLSACQAVYVHVPHPSHHLHVPTRLTFVCMLPTSCRRVVCTREACLQVRFLSQVAGMVGIRPGPRAPAPESPGDELPICWQCEDSLAAAGRLSKIT